MAAQWTQQTYGKNQVLKFLVQQTKRERKKERKKKKEKRKKGNKNDQYMQQVVKRKSV